MLKILKNKRTPGIIFIILMVLLGIYVFSPKETVPFVASTSPSDGDQEIPVTSQLSINFDPSIKDGVKPKITVSIEPQTDFDSTWLSNTYKIIPKSGLLTNTKYIIKVFYNKNIIYNFSFTTQVFSQADSLKYGKIQSQMDYSYGQAVKSLVSKYPFYTKLPIKTQNYIVDFDFSQNKFVITFIIQGLTPEQQNTLIQDAINNIKKIGGTDPVQYYIKQYAPPASPSPAP